MSTAAIKHWFLLVDKIVQRWGITLQRIPQSSVTVQLLLRRMSGAIQHLSETESRKRFQILNLGLAASSAVFKSLARM